MEREESGRAGACTMSSKADCRKFVPNIFNKSKCATCFKAKDEHSDEALENNRVSVSLPSSFR